MSGGKYFCPYFIEILNKTGDILEKLSDVLGTQSQKKFIKDFNLGLPKSGAHSLSTTEICRTV